VGVVVVVGWCTHARIKRTFCRLDWEIWIHTYTPLTLQPPLSCISHSPCDSTARLEAAALAAHTLPVPVFVDSLIKKILAGDSDAVDLTGTGRALLLGDGAGAAPPTAISAQYFWLNFSSNGSAWWSRSEIPNNPAVIYTHAADRCHLPSAPSFALPLLPRSPSLCSLVRPLRNAAAAPPPPGFSQPIARTSCAPPPPPPLSP
jgi:hypothetical protein